MNKIQVLLQATTQSERALPLLMGVLNVTPDSFSDGGRFNRRDTMIAQIERMVQEGAEIIDIGGESTRPGSTPVSLGQELDRVMPAIELVREHSDAAISVDTYKTEVMRCASEAGADLINDVNALQAPGAVEVVAGSKVSVCLMHKQGEFETMQQSPAYGDVSEEVFAFLKQRVSQCRSAGIGEERIILDPGFGFGKSLAHNIGLFRELDRLVRFGHPVLVGVSRKSMIGALAGDVPVSERMVGSTAAAVVAALKGARIVRVHDVKETRQALQVALELY